MALTTPVEPLPHNPATAFSPHALCGGRRSRGRRRHWRPRGGARAAAGQALAGGEGGAPCPTRCNAAARAGVAGGRAGVCGALSPCAPAPTAPAPPRHAQLVGPARRCRRNGRRRVWAPERASPPCPPRCPSTLEKRSASAGSSHAHTKASAERSRHASPRPCRWTTFANHTARTECRNTWARTGETSPPTKLPPFFFGSVITWIWIDPRHTIDVMLGHFSPLAQRPAEGALARPVGALQAAVAFGRTLFATTNHQRQCPRPGGLRRQGWALRLHAGQTLAPARHPGRTRGLVKQPLGLPVDQPGDPLAPLTPVACHGRPSRAVGGRLRLQAAPRVLRQPRWGRQPGTDRLPHRQVQPIRPHLGLLTEPLTAKAVRIRAQAAVRGRGPRLALAGPRAAAFPVEGIAPGLALAHAWQQSQGAPARWVPGMARVLLPRLLHGRAHPQAPRARAPGARASPPGGHPGRRRPGAAARAGGAGPAAGAAGAPGGACPTPRRLERPGLQAAPHDTPLPDGLAGACPLTGLGPAAPDLATRPASAATPGKGRADHAGVIWEARIAGLPAPLIFGPRALPRGRAAQPMPRPAGCGRPLPTPVAGEALRALILRASGLALAGAEQLRGSGPTRGARRCPPPRPGGMPRPAGLGRPMAAPNGLARGPSAGPHCRRRSQRAGAPARDGPGSPRGTRPQATAWRPTRSGHRRRRARTRLPLGWRWSGPRLAARTTPGPRAPRGVEAGGLSPADLWRRLCVLTLPYSACLWGRGPGERPHPCSRLPPTGRPPPARRKRAAPRQGSAGLVVSTSPAALLAPVALGSPELAAAGAVPRDTRPQSRGAGVSVAYSSQTLPACWPLWRK